MPGPARTGAVLYARNLAPMSAFYQGLLGMRVLHSGAMHQVIESPDMQLVLHAIVPPADNTAPAGTEPPVPRADQAVKLFFTVPSLADAERQAVALGGRVFGEVYPGPGIRMRNACDPEGNILQLRERVPPA